MELLVFAAMIAAGMLLLAFKLGVRKVLGYDLLFDIVITGIMMTSLSGSTSGMTMALLGGLIVSVVLLGLKYAIGKEQLKLNPLTRKLEWVQTRGYFA